MVGIDLDLLNNSICLLGSIDLIHDRIHGSRITDTVIAIGKERFGLQENYLSICFHGSRRSPAARPSISKSHDSRHRSIGAQSRKPGLELILEVAGSLSSVRSGM